ncbi:hypothetical protein BDK51DRAFT_40457 [Blyttiomyces helicus]|uniref:Uncharacterized protein n=1 Tax=Blyttiomyces helicus TaxID=388810 RepID=A0A4P9WEQ0_9FUNG|nr:hypothetical protein BDK51DRAFT_40457 [Blyttiomyces helicus]|eukprot:RKO89470.1 hypothetical protein BDK51DRAFT_40457 [Blyttiomyces helicus]
MSSVLTTPAIRCSHEGCEFGTTARRPSQPCNLSEATGVATAREPSNASFAAPRSAEITISVGTSSPCTAQANLTSVKTVAVLTRERTGYVPELRRHRDAHHNTSKEVGAPGSSQSPAPVPSPAAALPVWKAESDVPASPAPASPFIAALSPPFAPTPPAIDLLPISSFLPAWALPEMPLTAPLSPDTASIELSPHLSPSSPESIASDWSPASLPQSSPNLDFALDGPWSAALLDFKDDCCAPTAFRWPAEFDSKEWAGLAWQEESNELAVDGKDDAHWLW